MRHPRTDLRAVFGPHMSEGTRAVMLVHNGEMIERLRAESGESSRAYARSPEALARRRSAGRWPGDTSTSGTS